MDIVDDPQKLATKKNIGSLLILAILILAIPLGMRLVRQQQILKSKAATASATFVPPNVEVRTGLNGPVTVATQSAVGLELVPPDGWLLAEPSVTPSVTPSSTPTSSPSPSSSPRPATLQLVRYYNPKTLDQWSTTSKQTTTTPPGYILAGPQGYVLSNDDGLGKLLPLSDCYWGVFVDHFNDINAVTNCTKYTPITPLGFIYASQQPGTHPIYRCFGAVDHMTSLSSTCDGAKGYSNEGSLGWVLDSP